MQLCVNYIVYIFLYLIGFKVFFFIGLKFYIFVIFMKYYFVFIMFIGKNKLVSYVNWLNCECENIFCMLNIDINCWLQKYINMIDFFIWRR